MQNEAYAAEYSPVEELVHALTHGLGVLLSIGGLAVLIGFSTLYGDAWHITSTSIYGATLILLYTASTVYHSIPPSRAKSILQQLDHAAIFLLIAGTYTPFTLINLRGAWGWTIFAMIWGIAIIGVSMKLTRTNEGRYDRLSMILYLGMGWLILIALKPLLANVETGGIVLLLLGGMSYTVGAMFYLRDYLPWYHTVFHLLVMAGSIFHYFAILFYVIPASPLLMCS
jgi:hemolysin III